MLANSGITLNRVVQLPGEFILTYPKGYHSGFNLGFNAAESINFATERWLPLGKLAKACYCIGDRCAALIPLLDPNSDRFRPTASTLTSTSGSAKPRSLSRSSRTRHLCSSAGFLRPA